jgi:hypothetical protein
MAYKFNPFIGNFADAFAMTSAQQAVGALQPVAATSNGSIVLPDGTYLRNTAVNYIGVAGTAGFGIGICPAPDSANMTPMSGYDSPTSTNYGNYQDARGSVWCWIPAFRFRLGNSADPGFATYGTNNIRIVPAVQHPDEATANVEGYYIHRAFINGGQVHRGFFRSKYDCSALNGVAASLPNVQPMVSGPATGQVGFSAVGATNTYYGAIDAARTMGQKVHAETVFQADAICRLSEAHAQASTSTAYCAWYDPSGVRSYPKGNDNNALKSEADVILSGGSAVTWTSVGNATYPAFALAGSGNQVSKTTHNGQACGVTDIAGNIYKINPGMTCVASAVNITAATQTNPVRITATAHGYVTGDTAMVLNAGGMTQINDKLFTVTVIDANTVDLVGTDGTAFGAFTSGGTLTRAKFYALKPSVDIAAVTSGAALATDHWGTAGVAALFDELPMAFATTYPGNGFGQRYGNGFNAVFSLATAADRARSMTGIPAAGGVSTSGSNLMGGDYFYQYLINQLCVISRGYWIAGSIAGGRFRNLNNARSYANNAVGFAASCYL